MGLVINPPYMPMEARSVAEPPQGENWQYEPKWDGFRCLAFRDGDKVQLQSKSGQPLGRYFPDLVGALRQLKASKFVLDGEMVIPLKGRLSFDDLLMRVHPAASRVKKLAAEHPALFIVFDLLVDDRGKSLLELPLVRRRDGLEKFSKKYLRRNKKIQLSPATTALGTARRWFRTTGGNLDGIVAKRRDMSYCSGNREGMQKIKHRRTADCVVGGFRYGEGKKTVGSLLLGLYDQQGKLNHVGFTSSFSAEERRRITKLVEASVGAPGFTGKSPGGLSRWSSRRSDEWVPLTTKLVVEVQYDHFTGGRFRHGTRLLRFRPDKRPRQCTADQVSQSRGDILKILKPAGA
jgi:ATP-dependent DNA ligase